MISSFQVSPSDISYPVLPKPCLYEGAFPPTYPLPSVFPLCQSLHCGIKHSQAQRPLLPLMFNKATLATYAASTMSPFMCILWLVVQSLGSQGV